MALQIQFDQGCVVCGNRTIVAVDGLGLCSGHYAEAMNKNAKDMEWDFVTGQNN